MDLQQARRDVIAAVDAMAEELLAVSHGIHGEPELGFEEFKAQARLCAALDRHGLKPQRGAFGVETAYVAEFGGAGPRVAILSEYDALPGIGHACGHNVIASAGLGAALALSKLKSLPGSVRYLGTPAEEGGGGKEYMARAGAFEKVDAAMMVHPAHLEVATMPCLAVAHVDAIFHGKAAHASAMPHLGLNALDGVVLAYQAVGALRQHIKQSERLHGIITKGGDAANIVPHLASCTFYVRAADAHDLAPLKQRVQACFEAAALATGTRLETKWGDVDYIDMKTNWPLANAYKANAESLGRPLTPLEQLPSGMAGSTDMGNISHRVPSIHPLLKIAPEGVIIHNPEFARFAVLPEADKAVLDGAKMLALTALDMMASPSLASAAANDFAATKDESARALAHVFHGAGCGCH
ncbi:MAG: M20 family metallopeptidase [Alphaproteobacteria bacterium]